MEFIRPSNKWFWIALASITTFVVVQCKQQSKLSNPPDKVVKRVEKPKTFSSLVEKKADVDNGLENLIGLWFGHFEKEFDHAQALTFYDTITIKADKEAEEEDFYYDDVWYSNQKYERLPDKYKKWFYLDPLYGDYQPRTANAISIMIDKISGDSLFGRSVCAGNERNLIGKVVGTGTRGGSYEIVLMEPGDDVFDGRFVMDISTRDYKVFFGEWRPYNTNLNSKKLRLKSAVFSYVPEATEWELDKQFLDKNISLELLTEKDIENLSRPRLRILRNLIYARHGYSFKLKDVRTFFEHFEWYVPISTDVRNVLTTIELKNMKLMKRYEDYAEDYYDSYGR